MPNPTTIIDAFLTKGAQLFRERPFGPLPSLDEPLDKLAIPTLVYLRWLASTDAFVDQSVGSAIAQPHSPMEFVANLQTAFHGEIPGNSLSADALSFTVEYFSPRATYLSDFFSLFPESPPPLQEELWSGQEKVREVLDKRFLSWKSGEPASPKADDFEHKKHFVEAMKEVPPMTLEAWLSKLPELSNAIVDFESSVAYSNHFYTPLLEPPTKEIALATIREFLRSPPHDASLLCSVENFLTEIPVSLYLDAYAISVAQLLDIAPQHALSLLGYPCSKLDRDQIQNLISAIRLRNPHRDVIRELAELADEWNDDNDEPFASMVAAAKQE